MDKQTMMKELECILSVALSAKSRYGEVVNASELDFIADTADAILYELGLTDLESENPEPPSAHRYAIMMKDENTKIIDADDALMMTSAQSAGWRIVAAGESSVGAYELMHGFKLECDSRYGILQDCVNRALDALNGVQ